MYISTIQSSYFLLEAEVINKMYKIREIEIIIDSVKKREKKEDFFNNITIFIDLKCITMLT